MAQTTTQINACNAQVFMDDTGGTPVDISGSSNSASFTFTKQVGSSQTFDGANMIRVECKKDASLELGVIYTKDSNEARALIESWYDSGGRRTVSVYTWGQVGGGREYSGEWLITEYSFDADGTSADPIVASVSLVPTGDVTISTYTT